ncbi:slr1032 [Synechocystis sp. PCC 6803]|uniref:Slr1032 protein n=1 Tax=Synechocystis sp. (strain ATCC 27184 / PCC 6803 / Kazusa) TaxID=1111708 RepID=P73142_SYNY3|nr:MULTISPECIES: hypothetical protein [unclassified Synechocystis]BAM50887.1 hypothetical protein BEST7613_1956 [Synechocystis sp. PCC 6803] [Bacillus subtilis BEST7613]AGF50858.1 hypothetical protein MYO_16000 [Synechocystis sp. PCC 6803]ALJ66906.1 hypothetical protein AOY38_03050 [Synechocystis sp. PCC 6803]AVP88751.1 hypothetical protein C7I86_03070 [Synechocystis sp. IPPAS B-1465]MBD2617261.1 hypothetical protein [Synechocystis sp. FACHB-898]
MPTPQALYRGAVQAQGDDITQNGGYTRSWARGTPVTAQEGLDFLAKIEEQCNESQKEQRNSAFVKAERFIKNASKNGGVDQNSQPHPFQNPRRTVPNARVDIEIRKGLTFIPAKNLE